jgi:environmental stress-induced protein Ves
MRVLRTGDLVAVPWKNGGGITREIAVHPPGAGFDHFHWRLSMATVASDGPFSLFPGVDRTLILLDGDGIELCPEGAAPTRLMPGDRLDFSADIPMGARLLGGPVTDLNIMTRRTRIRPAITPLTLDGALTLELRDATHLLFCLSGAAWATSGEATSEIARHDTILLDTQQRAPLALHGSAHLVLIALHEVDPA